jgi:chromosome partitioning protein
MIIAVANQKGGVGKTTLALHLAFGAIARGLRVLLIDLDSQGNASATMAMDMDLPKQPGGATALFDGTETLSPMQTSSGVDLLHGHRRLDQVDQIDLATAAELGGRLKELSYDIVVIDTPPARLDSRHIAPMFWADRLVTPLEATSYSIGGLEATTEVVKLIQQSHPSLEPRYVLNRYRRVAKSQSDYATAIDNAIGLETPYLPLSEAVSAALEDGIPVWAHRTATQAVKDAWTTLIGGLLQ